MDRQDDEAEKELFEMEMRADGVILCKFDKMPCCRCHSGVLPKENICWVVWTDKKYGCKVPYFCGRVCFKGGVGWGISIAEKVERQGLFKVVKEEG